MKKINIVLYLLIITSTNAISQVSWEKLFSKQSTDVFRCVQEVPGNSGYICAGYTADSTVNDTDAYVVRLDLNGDTIWTYTYNGSQSRKDLFYKIINTADGGFIACGYTTSTSSNSDDFLYVKLNSSGHIQFDVTYGGSGKEHAQDIIETTDGYTIVGYTTTSPAQYYDATIFHTDFNGAIQWEKIIGGADYDDANTVKQLTDGGYILGGASSNGGNTNQYLIRLDVAGNTIWSKNLTVSGSSNIESLVQVSDGFVLTGSLNSGLSDDGYLVKTDTFGIVQWTRTFGGADQDDFHRIEKTNDGGFILSGTTSSSGAALPNMWLYKVNSNGDSTWARTFGGDNHDHGYSAVQTSDGGYIIAGHSGSFGFYNEDGYVVKLGPDGTGTNHLTYITAYALTSPTCSGSASTVKFTLRNFGNESVSNIPLTIELTGGVTQTLTANYAGQLNPGDVVTITFAPTVNTSGAGAITFHGFAGIDNDVYPENNSFTTTVTLTPCVGIEDVERDLGFKFYPNPANENIVLDFSQNYSNVKIELFNSNGEIVNSFMMNRTGGEKKIIDLSSYAKGLYLMKVNTEEGFDVRRIVLE